MELTEENSNTKNDNQSEIDEKVKQKLKEYSEFKCLYSLSNSALRFKRNISLLIQERIDKNIDTYPNKHNSYMKHINPVDVFDIQSVTNEIFGDYIKRHHINLQEEVDKYKKALEDKEKYAQSLGLKRELGAELRKRLDIMQQIL